MIISFVSMTGSVDTIETCADARLKYPVPICQLSAIRLMQQMEIVMKLTLNLLGAATAATLAFSALPMTAHAANHIVECADGTVYDFGPDDAISAEVACANHGGVKQTPFKASKIKSNGSNSGGQPLKRTSTR